MNRKATTASLLVNTLLALFFIYLTMEILAKHSGTAHDALAIVGSFLAFGFFSTLTVKQASALTR